MHSNTPHPVSCFRSDGHRHRWTPLPSATDWVGPVLTLEAHVNSQAGCGRLWPQEELSVDRNSSPTHTSSPAYPPVTAAFWPLPGLYSAWLGVEPASQILVPGAAVQLSVRLMLRPHPSLLLEVATDHTMSANLPLTFARFSK